MFGRADENPNTTTEDNAVPPVATEPATDPASTAPSVPDPAVTAPATNDTTESSPAIGINGVSLDSTFSTSAPAISPARPSMPTPSSSEPADASMFSTSAPETTPTATSTADDGDLIGIKQQALQSLEPLVDQLEQSPEEKFRTLMMLIQASDNSKLVKNAYEAAGKITDEKARAQALLDVVNEINYFTQQAKTTK